MFSKIVVLRKPRKAFFEEHKTIFLRGGATHDKNKYKLFYYNRCVKHIFIELSFQKTRYFLRRLQKLVFSGGAFL